MQAEVARNLNLGVDLLVLRSIAPDHIHWARVVRESYGISPFAAFELMRTARLYGDRPAVTRNASWRTLTELAWPQLPARLRCMIEARIIARDFPMTRENAKWQQVA